MDYEPLDTNADGVADAWRADYNGDGFYEEFHRDSNGDGLADIHTYDFNQDGFPELVGIDSNGDGVTDIAMTDYNQNGVYDHMENPLPATTLGSTEWASYSPSAVSDNPVTINTGNYGMSLGPGAEIVADTNTHTINNITAPHGYTYGPVEY